LFILKEQGYHIERTTEAINMLSEDLTRLLVKISKKYEQKEVDFGNEEMRKYFMKFIQKLLTP
jgi:hypothetical protein